MPEARHSRRSPGDLLRVPDPPDPTQCCSRGISAVVGVDLDVTAGVFPFHYTVVPGVHWRILQTPTI
jgi:hypothetical protein